jgi:hypothetical protein
MSFASDRANTTRRSEIRLRVLSKALGDSSSDLLSESPALIDQQIAWRLVERIERAEAARRLAKGDEANA